MSKKTNAGKLRTVRSGSRASASGPDARISVYRASPSEGRAETTKFGSVVVTGFGPDVGVIAQNVERGVEALARASKKLLKPGVAIRAKKDVPHYAVVDGEPGVFVRRLNGRTERGRVVNGMFKVID